ncbi:hypothetical protein KVT40_008085 [Elsinoe batatas]|uniref:Uncharacterized protein n=1 Tax=Elsinoe batatas TaxID=2601811 RepID=A0A8K0KUQ4_9PEZI|nr:hypothetical protein KVT40_008085 [Elsinoe batatas]
MKSVQTQIKSPEQRPLDEATNVYFNIPLRNYQCKAVTIMPSPCDPRLKGACPGITWVSEGQSSR